MKKKKWEEKQTRQDHFIKQVQEQSYFYFKSFHPFALTLFRWMAETALFSFWLSWSLLRSLLSPLNARNNFFLRKKHEDGFYRLSYYHSLSCKTHKVQDTVTCTKPLNCLKIDICIVSKLSTVRAFCKYQQFNTWNIPDFHIPNAPILNKETKPVWLNSPRTASKFQMPPVPQHKLLDAAAFSTATGTVNLPRNQAIKTIWNGNRILKDLIW